MKKMKRDIQGKFAIKNSDYREVRSIRLTSDTWKELGIASECLGLSRADYLEEIVRKKLLPCNTWKNADTQLCITRNDAEQLPSITRYEQEIETLKVQVQNLQLSYSVLEERSAMTKVHEVVDYEAVRDRILSELKLGRQAHSYKIAQKALNKMIAQLKLLAISF